MLDSIKILMNYKESKMDTITQTIIAVSFMFASYYWGRHLTAQYAFSFMMDWLEEQKFVKVEVDENGEKYFVKLED